MTKTSKAKWRVRWLGNDPETEPAFEYKTLSAAVGRAKGMDERFRKGTRDVNGNYIDCRTGIIIERIEQYKKTRS